MLQASPGGERRRPGDDREGSSSPAGLLEREQETAALSALLDRVCDGAGEMLVLQGTAGIGKSRLLRWLAEQAGDRELLVLGARGGEAERDFSFGVARQLFERQLVELDEPLRRSALSGSASLSLPLFAGQPWGQAPEPRAQALDGILHGLYWLTANLSADAPVLLTIDDLQWADQSSLRFLLYLLQRCEDLPVAVVVTRRPSDGRDPLLDELAGHPLATRLTLAPLSPEAVGSLLERRLGRPPGSRFVQACFAASGGNPFLVEAVAQAILEDGIEPEDQHAETIGVLRPEAVRQQVLVRVSRLGGDAAQLAAAATVLGDGSLLEHVCALAGLTLDAGAAAADALVRSGILAASTPVSFAHPLLRATLYDEIAGAQRGRMHARAAQLLHDDHQASELVAAQLLCATRIGEPWAYEQLHEAAAKALATGSPEPAVRYLSHALTEPLERQQRADTLLALTRAQASVGDPTAERHLHEALTLLDDRAAQARAHHTLGTILYTRGDLAGAADAFEQGLATLADPGDPLARDLHAAYFSAASLVPDLAAQAREHIAPLLQRSAGTETASERGALAGAAVHLAVAGAPRAQALALADRAWGDGQLLADEGPDGWAWSLVTGAFSWTDAFEASLQASGAVIDEARRRGSLMAHATASFAAAYPTHMVGRLAEARAHAESALDARRFGWLTYPAALAAGYAVILFDQDELELAERELEVLDDPEYGTHPGRAMALTARGQLRLMRGHAPEALADFLSAGRTLTALSGPDAWLTPWRTGAALAAHQLGDEDRAGELLDRARQVAQTTGTPTHLVHVLRTQARFESGTAAIELLQQALATLADTEAVTERIRLRAELGAALRRAGRRPEARAALTEAATQAHAIGAWAIERRAREELKVAGARLRRLSFSGADALTASERRVAEMAATGISNREIAQALFVTPRTVEQHLYNSYKKLGIRSRTELEQALQTRSEHP